MNFYHWKVKGKEICAFVHSANIYSPIATVDNKRAVNQMLAYANLGEDIEHLVDRLVSGNLKSDELAVIEMVELVRKAVEKTL